MIKDNGKKQKVRRLDMKIMANRMDRGFFRYQEEFEAKALRKSLRRTQAEGTA